LIRESQEEVGLTPTDYSLAADLPDPCPRLHGEGIHHVYIVRTWEGGEPQMLGDEHTDLCWFAPVEACALPDLAIDAYRPIFMSLA
jgi:8-oxo-dGTP diphosphatase